MTAQTDRKSVGAEGFTLLEVMVAVAVLAIGVVPLLVTHGATVSNIRRGREVTLASLLARERLAELEVIGFAALNAEAGFPSYPGGGPPSKDPHPFLKLEEAVEEIEVEAMLEVRVGALRRLQSSGGGKEPSGEGEDPSGVRLATYIVSLYFDPDEDLEMEE